MDINSYTGKPYSFMSYNCWHHVCAVRKDHGFQTKLFTADSPGIRAVARAFKKGFADKNNGLTKVQEPKNFDIAIGSRRAMLFHSGVYFDGMVSHCGAGRRQVVVCTYESFREMFTEFELWR